MNHQYDTEFDTEFFDSSSEMFTPVRKPTLAYRIGHRFGSILSKFKHGTQTGINAINQEMHLHLEDIAAELYANQEALFTAKVKKLQRRHLLVGLISSVICFLAGMVIAVISFM